MATTLTKKYRLIYSGSTIIELSSNNDASSITGTNKPCFETDDMDEMKTKLATLGLTPDPRTNPEFV
jgi:hypothetical protein